MAVYSHHQVVRFPDVDHAGIAFFGALLTYCHYCHEEWLKRIGFPLHTLLNDIGTAFPIVRVEAEFVSPARHGDDLRVDLDVDRMGTKSIVFHYVIYNSTTNLNVGEARITQVSTRMVEMVSTPIPEDFRRAVSEWEREEAASGD
jgi:4-hydroxybenzoyl-CoA thioesterase